MVVKGSIVLVNFPFTDLSQTKLRPAIVLWINPRGGDVVVCAITSQKIDRLDEDEFKLDAGDPEFSKTGLRVSSKVKTTRIATLNRQLVTRKLGDLSFRHIQQLDGKLAQAFQIA
ncbi:type II toxin-antitoxin system PemK/MazF family toxin [Nodosilinea sp. LEGE 07298]|uniref:type II toxin-antitoxin system PemK/MazF family toxin n=1 Tax=Nodosilinea sp. LEGE 07298 TaxID=2777970 RepID=UPI00187DE5A6|nr:type II toxin-antitoxin system PemK/MazF family toxin [Nodosilinea sp. LEGE 07298]MBE9111227.1 type II toxin-antitoxin system PemK/MazF family toxin [Nodosilinea sp. LEGE 07298]